MEKENKYYGIIENLIKRHKKFVGLEAILEDIINDVYSHSEVILRTVNDEGVINAYLEKVVSTSIITVPKQMNFNSSVNHREIITSPHTSTLVKKVDNSLVDKMINLSSNTSDFDSPDVIETKEETLSELEETTTFSDNELFVQEEIEFDNNVSDIEPEIADLQTETQNSDISEHVSEEMEEDIQLSDFDTIDLDTFETVEEHDVEPLDIVESTESTEHSNATSDTDDEPSQQSELSDDIVELAEEEPEDIPETQQFDLEEDTQDSSASFDTDDEPSQQSELSDDIVELAEEEPEEPFEKTEIDENQELILNETFEDDTLLGEFEELPEPETLCETDTDLSDELINNSIENSTLKEEDTSLDITSQDEDEDEAEDEDESSVLSQEEKILDFVPTDYSAFNFEPKTEKNHSSIDTDMIIRDLKDLSAKYPELRILDIYNCKYTESLSVSEVASKLNMSENSVIDALNEIIAVI